jgi:predicted CXXCH cytochrome family protein
MALDARFWSDGQVRVSGREFTGMAESPCFQRGDLSCLSCHSMHDSDPNDQLLQGMGGDEACLQCHGAFRGKISEHTRHAVGSSGSSCYSCHMPHTTYGLLTAMRSHTIDSPRVVATLQTGRPNACNLCHLDQTLAWTGEHLNRWYGQPLPSLLGDEAIVSAAVLTALEGDAGQRALIAWSMGWEPAQEASGRGWLAPYLGHLLNDPYAAVRFVAQRSLRGLPGFGDFEYDYLASPMRRARARGRALDRWLAAPLSALDRHGDRVLITPDGNLQVERIAAFAARRNDRLVALGE